MRSSFLFALLVRACSLDLDHDGYSPAATVAGMADCDDNNPAVHPGADEKCGAIDENCDGDPEAGAVDGPCVLPDLDGDGYDQATDCNDADAAVFPGAQERCDGAGTDEDCDGLVDDADPSVDPAGQTEIYTDADGDGFGEGQRWLSCRPPTASSTVDGD
ncbi:MAG TPA: putative metal-binding motif-containing protein, partial [Myxococcota bacterium]|nr:putative metal-binding motif-containing protein [Myxococcota bacterium]